MKPTVFNVFLAVAFFIFGAVGGIVIKRCSKPAPKHSKKQKHYRYEVSWGSWPYKHELPVDSFQYHKDDYNVITVWIDGREVLINCGYHIPVIEQL